MEKYIFYILLLLSLLIIILIAGLGVLAYYFLRQQQSKAPAAAGASIAGKPIYRPAKINGYCADHHNEKALALCAVCSKSLCEACASEAENLYFCTDHFQVYLEHDWVAITNFKTTPDDPKAGVAIYEFKDKLWAQENIPSFIVTHYRINIESDYIESYVQLNVRDEDKEVLDQKLKGHLEGALY